MSDENTNPDDFDFGSPLPEDTAFGTFKLVRLMGIAPDEAELRRISCALAFVGYVADLRVGVSGDEWGWRTPLLDGPELALFIELTELFPVAFSPSQTTPEHGNIMVGTFEQIQGGEDDG